MQGGWINNFMQRGKRYRVALFVRETRLKTTTTTRERWKNYHQWQPKKTTTTNWHALFPEMSNARSSETPSRRQTTYKISITSIDPRRPQSLLLTRSGPPHWTLGMVRVSQHTPLPFHPIDHGLVRGSTFRQFLHGGGRPRAPKLTAIIRIEK